MSRNMELDENIRIGARYAILGAMIGDSLGSTVEFKKSCIAKELVSKYSNFKNGLVGIGPFKLNPGQFTDDSEMSLAIMYVIINNGKYDQRQVSQMYHKWYLSEPFDIGKTIETSVSNQSLEQMLHVSKKYNYQSLSNGFLMRLFGLISLYYNKSQDELINSIVEDVSITHGHPEAMEIAITYGLMLKSAIMTRDWKKVYSTGKKYAYNSPLFSSIFMAVDNDYDFFIYNEKRYDMKQIDSAIFGFVGFSLWLLLLSLKKHKSYESAIIEIVKLGGDTDTNACIVGSVMGALYPDTIPKKWINSILNCNATWRYKKYPIADPSVWKNWLP